MRLFWFFLGLVLVISLPFLFAGGGMEAAFSWNGTLAWLSRYGLRWAWLAGMVLLISDLLLPLPGTVIMSVLGYLYGTLVGGLVAAVGLFVSGAIAYLLCRRFGQKAACHLMGPTDMAWGQRLFSGVGGPWIVALSRCLPLLPEVISCMAGLTNMPARRFFTALVSGCLPTGILFAWIGQTGKDNTSLAIALSLLIPVLLYGLAILVQRKTDVRTSDPAHSTGRDGS